MVLVILINIDLIAILVVALKLNQVHIFLLYCHHFSNIRSTLLNSINNVLGSITTLDDYALVKILLLGDQNYSQVENSFIINATVKYLVNSERFDGHFCSYL